MRNQRRSSVGGEGAADTSGAVPPSPLLRWLTLIELDLMGFSGQGQFEGWHQLKSEGQRRWLGCLSSCSSSSASSTCILSSRSGVLRIGLSLHLFPSPNKLTAPLSKGKGSYDTRFSDLIHEFILDWFVTLSAIVVAARGWRCWESRRHNITETSRQDFRNGYLFFLTTSLQAGLENSRGGGIQLAWADREHDAQALTGEDAMSAVCEWLSLWFASVNYIHHCLHNTTPHFQTLIFFSRVLTGRPTGNCWRPWWDWRRAMPGDRRQSTRWMSCRWRCWRWWSTFSNSRREVGVGGEGDRRKSFCLKVSSEDLGMLLSVWEMSA